MDQDEFINTMRDSLYSGYLGGGKGGGPPLRAILAKLSTIVPIIARYSLLGGLIYLGYTAYENRVTLICVALAILWVGRGHLRFFSYNGLLGSARFMTIAEMRRNGYFDGVGLILGRGRETKPGKLAASIQLVAKPLKESEGAVRGFIDAMTNGKLNLIRVRDEPLVRLKEFIHVLLFAPPRSGKGVSFLVPTLMTWDQACVVGDPKDGELFGLTAHIRESMGFDVIRLDPFSQHGPGGHGLNILELLDANDPKLVAKCRQLADTLIPRTGQEKDPHFSLNAYGLLSIVITYVVCHAPPGTKNMNLVRHLLSDVTRLKGYWRNDHEFVKGAFHYMAESKACGGTLAEGGTRFNSVPEREFGSIITTVNTAIEFLGDPNVAEHVSKSTFDIRATTRNTTVYLCLPANFMSQYANLMKMWLACFLLAKRDEGLGEESKVLFILDEVGNLGDMKILEGAVHEGAGYGIRMFLVFQAIGQLEANFPSPRCDHIMAGCDVKLCMGINDLKSAKMFCEMLGQSTITVIGHSAGDNQSGGGLSGAMNFGSNRGKSFSPQARPLLTVDEFMRSDAAYAFIKGQPPLALSPVKYYEDRAFEPFNARSLQPTPCIFSWLIALAGLYFTLPVAFGFAWDQVPALPRWTANPTRRPSEPSPVSSPPDDGQLSNLIFESASRQPAPSAPQAPAWPSEATCPKCELSLPTPEGYSGQRLRCPDCKAQFLILRTP